MVFAMGERRELPSRVDSFFKKKPEKASQAFNQLTSTVRRKFRKRTWAHSDSQARSHKYQLKCPKWSACFRRPLLLRLIPFLPDPNRLKINKNFFAICWIGLIIISKLKNKTFSFKIKIYWTKERSADPTLKGSISSVTPFRQTAAELF